MRRSDGTPVEVEQRDIRVYCNNLTSIAWDTAKKIQEDLDGMKSKPDKPDEYNGWNVKVTKNGQEAYNNLTINDDYKLIGYSSWWNDRDWGVSVGIERKGCPDKGTSGQYTIETENTDSKVRRLKRRLGSWTQIPRKVVR